MTAADGFNDKVSFIWSVADLLRGDIRQHEYGQFILPFVVLRRLDCVLEPTKQQVIAKAKDLDGKVSNVDPILERVTKAPFYNTSPLSFTDLLNDPSNIGKNLRSYVSGFSPDAADVLDKYRLAERIDTLDKAGLLYQVVARFADIDLHPDTVPNQTMGYIFEELLRRFSEMQNETAGEHFTPREVIKLMVNILFSEDEPALSGPAPVRTMLDPACGTGGMLSTAQDHLRELNPNAHLEAYGQELNPETWAICRSDMLIKGENPENIVLGNSFTADGHAGHRVDYLLANPPFGVDWKKYADPIQAEAENEGFDGRFGAGLPRVSDGSFLFLQHMIAHMKPVTPTGGGSRLAIVFSGSPLFSGAVGSGESNIRRWIIENDWLEAIVALPDQLFYNTGISTYFWVLTNRKRPERKGKVALIDVRREATKMRKSLGNKRNYLSDDTIAELTRLYADAPDTKDERVKILPNEAFGFQRITVEQPMRRKWVVTDDVLAALGQSKAWGKHAADKSPAELFASFVGPEFTTEKDLATKVAELAPTPVVKELVKLAAIPDPDAPDVTDRKGNPLPDPDLRDYENVPLGQDPEEYLAREVHPYAPGAWIDHTKTKIGYEIPFTRHFYVYTRPRPVTELDGEIAKREARIRELLGGLA
ncbi:class I SAM-dependent DNA methyltransferase [Rhodococcus opacus]|uniref:site-specific DNA-methyltransferase (adenine-specific) n=1 Tax=Rhodococcus opacus TaxID=37919 RepID=A0AAX3YQU4_RHOOP|nr:class I SAM-dependent DNA methyltransferase [Rhodococcus opacus]MCZ4587626.1 class I SAM-dependent DNA methyltransferase [Rhodococcus opacus]WLF51378.1 class I SAM-dependent DNA methyltransferase [Rhodococcus opacus]